MKDTGAHHEIRERMVKGLRDTGAVVHSSHEGLGDNTAFRWDQNNRMIELAEPDIVVQSPQSTLFIEIELSDAPKHLLGVAMAIYVAKEGQRGSKTGRVPIRIRDKHLMIVLGPVKDRKKTNKKEVQAEEVERIINEILPVGFVEIVDHSKAAEAAIKWCRENQAIEVSDIRTLVKENFGVEPRKLSHYELALTDNSLDNAQNNERLAFLGDSIIKYSVRMHLYEKHKDWNIGKLTEESKIESNDILAGLGRDMGLKEHIRYGQLYEGKGKDEAKSSPKIMSRAVEAIIGAICFDRGFPEAQRASVFLLRNELK